MASLRPSDTTQKLLISTTSDIIGSYERDGILLRLAWPQLENRFPDKLPDRRAQRSAFVIAFETEPIARLAGVPVPNHSYLGETVCSYLSVLFGKRFDNHGSIENCGSFYVPDLRQFDRPYLPTLPQNSVSPALIFASL